VRPPAGRAAAGELPGVSSGVIALESRLSAIERVGTGPATADLDEQIAQVRRGTASNPKTRQHDMPPAARTVNTIAPSQHAEHRECAAGNRTLTDHQAAPNADYRRNGFRLDSPAERRADRPLRFASRRAEDLHRGMGEYVCSNRGIRRRDGCVRSREPAVSAIVRGVDPLWAAAMAHSYA
jgi:hypothetical protein